MKKLNVMLIRKIRKTMGQYVAIILVVIIGIMVYLGMSMAMENMRVTVDHYMEQANAADIYVELHKIPKSALRSIGEIEGIETIQGRILEDVPMITHGDENVNVRVVSIPDKGMDTINRLFIHHGSDLTSDYTVLPIKSFYDARNMCVGDRLTLHIKGKNYTMTVNGVGASPEFIYSIEDEQTLVPDPAAFGVLFVTESFAERAFEFNNHYNQLLIKVTHKDKIDSIVDELEKKLDRYGVIRVYGYEDHVNIKVVDIKIEGGQKSAGAVPIIFLGVAAFIIVVMINKIINNDRMAIGIIKAMGYSNYQLILHYAMYAIGIGVVGGAFGIYFGIDLSKAFAQMFLDANFDIPMLKGKIYYGKIFGGIILTALFCGGAGFIGSLKVIQIHPAESMRPEAPKIGEPILLEKIPFLWNRIQFSWKMILKNIIRSKKKFLLLVLGIALTFSVVQMPFFMYNATNTIFYSHYQEFFLMDYNLTFERPMNEEVLSTIKGKIDYDAIEGKIEYPVEIKNNWKKETITIIGIERDTSLLNFVDLNGIPVNVPKKGIIISEGVARKLDIKKGDRVGIKSFIGKKEEVYVDVIDVVSQKLGMNVYMNIDTLRNTFYDKEMITGAYIKSGDDVEEQLKNMEAIGGIQSTDDMSAGFEEYLELMIGTLGVLVIFGGILGFAIVYNATIITIRERQLEFSSLRVMGFTKNEIFKMVVYENIILTILGIILGIPLANVMRDGVAKSMANDFMSLNIQTPPSIHIYAGLLTIFFVMVAQFATYGKIYKLNFIDALKNRIS